MAKQEPKEMSKLDAFWDALGNKSESTKSGYRTAIWQFIHFIYKDAKKDTCSQYVDRYFTEERNRFTDFKKFIQSNLTDKPGLSALQTFNQIKNFHALCDVTFSAKEINLLKNQLPSGGVETQEADMDTETIRAILQHCDVKTKAIILCLASGGMRIGELLNVRCADVDIKPVPSVIQIRAKHMNGNRNKTGMQRYTFISSEAVAAVREWIKIRPAYLQDASMKGKNFKTKELTVSVDDERLFPVSDNSVTDAFKDAVTAVFGKNEVDPTTGRSVRHIHQLRKFFISQLSLVTSESVADFFAGHKTALSDNYRRYTTKQMAEYYIKAEHMLYVEGAAEAREATTSTKKEIAEIQKDQHKATNQLVSVLAREAELKDTVKKQEKMLQAQGAQMQNMQALIEAMERQQHRLSQVVDRYAKEMGWEAPAPLDEPLPED